MKPPRLSLPILDNVTLQGSTCQTISHFGPPRDISPPGAVPRRQGSVVDEIQRLIRQSVAVIVDLSEAKPNVLYEAGYAHALNKPCIHICSTSTEKLPFDVSHWKTTLSIPATPTNWRELAQRLKAILD